MKASLRVCIGIAVLVGVGERSGSQEIKPQAKQQALDRCYANPNRYERYCDVREFVVPARGSLRIDGAKNGDVTVHGSDDRSRGRGRGERGTGAPAPWSDISGLPGGGDPAWIRRRVEARRRGR